MAEADAAGQLQDAVRSRRRGQPFPLAITFDDDLRTHRDVVLPMLRQLDAVATFFLTLTGAISVEGTFWLYAGFGVGAIIFFALRLPETKGRSLEEISEEVSDAAAEAAS